MPLKVCQECQYSVDTQTTRCPRCGSEYQESPLVTTKSGGVDWQTRTTFYGYPLIHVAFGRDEHGRFRVAKGVIAIGQFGIGLITFAQIGVGILFGLGQVMIGLTAIAQVAVTLIFALGQISIGYIAIGQVAVGIYVRCMVGFGQHVWSMQQKDPMAATFFRQMTEYLLKR